MLNARNGSSPNFGTKKNPKYRLRDEYKGHWDAVIVDEAHYTKGRKTSWTWAVQQLAKNSEYFLEMTGTPVPNWAHEIDRKSTRLNSSHVPISYAVFCL